MTTEKTIWKFKQNTHGRQIYANTRMVLSDKDLGEILIEVRHALNAFMKHSKFQTLLHHVLCLPSRQYASGERPQNIWMWDIKAWSHLCTLTGLFMKRDPGNVSYGFAVMLMVAKLSNLPDAWEKLVPD